MGDHYNDDNHVQQLASRSRSRRGRVNKETQDGGVQERSNNVGDEHSMTLYNSNLLDSFELKHLVWDLQSRDVLLFPSTPTLKSIEQANSSTMLAPHHLRERRSSCCMSTFTLYSPCYIALFHIFKHLKRVAKLTTHAKQYV